MAASRTMLSIGWSLQRAQHGEQPFWALVTLAAMLGQIGLPGGGFACGYGPSNLMGSGALRHSGPTLPQGANPVRDFIPVARIADMLLHPGARFAYNGAEHFYPDIRLVYWAGGNPFHHHQDLNRLRLAWRKPETVVFHEQFWTPAAKMADIVLPATTGLERDDIGYAAREPYLIAMKKAREPIGEARDDHAIFQAIARRMGVGPAHSGGRETGEWLAHLYEEARARSAKAGVDLPAFEEFWEAGIAEATGTQEPPVLLGAFRADPAAHPLKTPSGRIEIYSEKHRLVRLRRLPAACRLARADRVAGRQDGRALSAAHAVGPARRQIAQPARSRPAFPRDQGSRAVSRSRCIPRTPPGAASPRATWCVSSTTAAPASPRRA